MKTKVLLMAAGIWALSSVAAIAQDVVKIGGLFGTTGPQANFGVPYSQGLQLAVNEINAAGGIKAGGKTYQVKLTLADTKSDPSQAVAEAQRMLADGVTTIFCCNVSAESIPVLQAALPPSVMLISPNAGMMRFLGQPGRELLFRFSNSEIGKQGSTALIVPYMVEKYQPKTAAIMVPNDETGQIYADSYKEVLEAHGVKVVSIERFDYGTTDFTPQLTSVRRANPDLLVAGFSDEVRGIFRQASELGIKAKFAGTVGVSGAAGEGQPEFVYAAWTRHLGPEQKDPKVIAYMRNLEKIGKLTSYSFWSVTQYDGMHMLAKAMEAAGTVTDMKAVAAKMRGQTYSGLVDWYIDQKGQARQNMEGIHVKGGKIVEIKPLLVPKE
jgi:branched-chain amino acid transport system substrate-binding protein